QAIADVPFLLQTSFSNCRSSPASGHRLPQHPEGCVEQALLPWKTEYPSLTTSTAHRHQESYFLSSVSSVPAGASTYFPWKQTFSSLPWEPPHPPALTRRSAGRLQKYPEHSCPAAESLPSPNVEGARSHEPDSTFRDSCPSFDLSALDQSLYFLHTFTNQNTY